MKILFIGLDYHHYTRAIVREWEAAGHQVSFHDIFRRSLYEKSLRLISKRRQRAAYDAYHREIIASEAGTAYDMVCFLQCHQVAHETLELARSTFRNAKFVLYNWDSVSTHDYRDRLKYFDRAFTFDIGDARALGIEYLPLFGTRDFQDVPLPPEGAGSIYFVGNIVNPQRYHAIDEFRRHCESDGIEFDCFMAVRPVVIPGLLRAARPRGVSLRPIAPGKFQTMLRRSKATFDFANHAQTGMTMRVIENLCAGRKIVTTNPHVRTQWFYASDRVLIVEKGKYEPVAEFLATPLEQPAAEFSEFHIQTFARHLLGDRGHPLDGSRPPAL